MMILCKNLLGFHDFQDPWRHPPSPRRCRRALSVSEVPGLRYVAGELPASSQPHVVESAAVGLGSRPPPLTELHGQQPPAETTMVEEVPGWACCFYGEDSAARLELCTESLGFESCCDGRVGTEEERRAEQETSRRIEEWPRRATSEEVTDRSTERRRRRREKIIEAREFPPPLPSLGASSVGGQSTCFLKAEKKEGRLVLKEVGVERPEILRASRRDGRLRLEFVKAEREEARTVAEAVQGAEVMENEEEPSWLQLPAAVKGERRRREVLASRRRRSGVLVS